MCKPWEYSCNKQPSLKLQRLPKPVLRYRGNIWKCSDQKEAVVREDAAEKTVVMVKAKFSICIISIMRKLNKNKIGKVIKFASVPYKLYKTSHKVFSLTNGMELHVSTWLRTAVIQGHSKYPIIQEIVLEKFIAKYTIFSSWQESFLIKEWWLIRLHPKMQSEENVRYKKCLPVLIAFTLDWQN